VIEVLAIAAVVVLVLVAGIRVGMLVAPRLYRWTEPDDEEPRDDRPG
jgi:hypothetical protein